MKNRIALLAVLSLAAVILMGAARPDFSAFLAAAAPTVFRPDTGTGWQTPALPGYRESLAVTQMPTTATEPSSNLDGFELKNFNLFDLHVEIMTNPQEPANDAGSCDPTTAADKDANAGLSANTLPTQWLRAYIYNPANGKWHRAPTLDQQVIGGKTTWAKVGITPPSNVSRIAYTTETTNPCPLKVYIISR